MPVPAIRTQVLGVEQMAKMDVHWEQRDSILPALMEPILLTLRLTFLYNNIRFLSWHKKKPFALAGIGSRIRIFGKLKAGANCTNTLN